MDLTFSTRSGGHSNGTPSFMATHIDDAGGTALPQEIEQGNVEYKLKLINPPPERLQHLVTQLKWRLAEGHGEAIYEIGVSDQGELVGLSRKDMQESIKTLKKMGAVLNADVSIIRERVIQLSHSEFLKKEKMLATYSSSHSLLGDDDGDDTDADEEFGFSLDLDDAEALPSKRSTTSLEERVVAEVLVRKGLEDDRHFLEIRVAIVGGADAGKSTLLGVLADSDLDNGRGKSRLNLLRHRHEIETGRTSSISHQIIGFDARGDLVNYGTTNISTLEQICEASAKIVSFLDMCGHPKYQKTTLSGLTGHSPDYACLIIGANAGGVSEVPREHLGIAVALMVSVFIVITKVDVASAAQLTRTVNSLLRLLKSPGICRVPMVIQNEDDLVVAVSSLVNSRVIPIFLTSSVTGENMNLLEKFLNLLPKPATDSSPADSAEPMETNSVEFSIEETYNIPGLGSVVGGLLTSGHLSPHAQRTETFYLGPDRGRFVPIRITSIHRQRIPIAQLTMGQAATCAISFVRKQTPDPDGEQQDISPVGINIRSISPTTSSSIKVSQSPPVGFKVRKGQVILAVCPETAIFGASQGGSSVPSSPSLQPIQVGSPSKTITTVENSKSITQTSSSLTVFKPALSTTACAWEFEADIHVIHGAGGTKTNSPEVAVGTSGVAYLGSVRQGARIVKLQDCTGKWAGLVPGDVPVDEVDASEDVGGDYFIVPAKGRRRSSSVVSSRPASAIGVAKTDDPSNFDVKRNQFLDSPNLAGTLLRKAGGGEAESPNTLFGTPSRKAIVSFDLGPSVLPPSDVSSPSYVAPPKRSSTPTPTSPRRNSQRLIISSVNSPTAIANALASPIEASLDQQIPPVLKTGGHGRIRLRFSHEPEWIKIGSTVLFRGEGRLKCVGKVVGVVATAGQSTDGR
ncbi:UNVERIFIED_CONTAM: GTP binding protein [Siphonaria sp. JEL0065]|nr:GTP binding protein [Siphonaria sp. JEL0065]